MSVDLSILIYANEDDISSTDTEFSAFIQDFAQ
jgi:hypothetical protein